MATISELVVKIVGDNSSLKSSLDDSGKSIGGLESKAASLAKIIGPAVLGAAFIATAKAIADYISEVSKAADVIDKTSIRTGISTGELQKLKYAAGQTGVAFSAIQSSVTIMTRSLETNEKVFKDLNIQVKNTDGTFRKTDEIFNDTVAVLSDMKDETARNSLALQLFGRGAAEMTPLLDQGSAGIKTLTDRSETLGLVMSDKLIKAGVEFGDLTSDLGQATQALGYTFAETLIPSLNLAVGGLVKIIQGYVGARNAAIDFDTYIKEGATSATNYESALAGAEKELRRLIEMREVASRQPDMAIMSLDEIDKQIEAVKKAKRELDQVAIGQEMNKRFAGDAAKAQEAQALAAAKVVAQLEVIEKMEKKYLDARAKVLNILEDTKTEHQKIQDQIEELEKTPWAKGQLEDDRLAAITALKYKQTKLIQKEIDERKKAEDENIKAWEESNKKREQIEKDFKDEKAQIDKQNADNDIAEAKRAADEKKRINNELYSLLTSSMSTLASISATMTANEIAEINAETQAKLEAAGLEEQTTMEKLTAERDAAIAAGDAELVAKKNQEIARQTIIDDGIKKTAQAQYKGALAQWTLSLATTVADSISAVVRSMASLPWPLNLVPAGVQTGLGIAQVNAFMGSKPKAPALARGSDFTAGGATLVGEEGPEVVNMPRGASVTPNSRGGNGGGPVFNIYSPVAVTPSIAAQEYTRMVRNLAFEGVL